MSTDDKQPFLARWSRRKLESARRRAAPNPAAPAPSGGTIAPAAPAAQPARVEPELPPIESLQGLSSEYKGFLDPKVDEKLRRFALKKLFHDPHFNVMDGLDTYIDDYSKPDPIPAEMLERLKQANRVLFPEEPTAKDRADESRTGGIAAPGATGGSEAQADAGTETPASPAAPEDRA